MGGTVRNVAGALAALCCALALSGAQAFVSGAPVESSSTPSAPSLPSRLSRAVAVIPRNVPPTAYYDEKTGAPAGFAVEVMNRIAENAGLRLTYVYAGSWEELERKVLDGEADIIPSLGITDERKRLFGFTLPIETVSMAVFVRDRDDRVIALTSSMTVGVIKGSLAADAVKKTGARILLYDNLQTGVFELLAGHIDAFVGPVSNIQKLLRDAGIDDEVRMAGRPLFEAKRAIAVKKENTALRARLSRATEQFITSSEYRQLYAKWYGKPKPFWTEARLLGAAAALLLLTIFLMAWWRYRSLLTVNRQLQENIANRRLAELKQQETEGERQKLEAQLYQAQKMEAIGQLAGGVAHDFNNLLTAILGYATLLDGRVAGDPQAGDHVRHILSATEKAAHLTRSLLAFSRKQVMASRLLDLNGLVAELETLLRRLLREDIEFVRASSAAPLTVMADQVQLEQVIINLVTNARDAMPGGGRLVIETSLTTLDRLLVDQFGLEKPGDYAVVSVTDTGTGMESATMEKIFEPFFTTKERGKGTGLGLAVAFGIVKQHNGFLHVYSEPDKGSTFRIYLPLAASGAVARLCRDIPADIPVNGTEMVLLAEDNPEVMGILKAALEGAGYRVIGATDGDEAVRKFAERPGEINLVILDLIMPKKNGAEAHREITRLAPGVKALFTSGYAEDMAALKDMQEQGVAFVQKPVAPREFLHKVRAALDARGNACYN